MRSLLESEEASGMLYSFAMHLESIINGLPSQDSSVASLLYNRSLRSSMRMLIGSMLRIGSTTYRAKVRQPYDQEVPWAAAEIGYYAKVSECLPVYLK